MWIFFYFILFKLFKISPSQPKTAMSPSPPPHVRLNSHAKGATWGGAAALNGQNAKKQPPHTTKPKSCLLCTKSASFDEIFFDSPLENTQHIFTSMLCV
ncbi:hypothetical protein HanRHA438_Chr04g0181941 [Helianthus annuus]|nr:hypothetical protein HanRHA438_Chr04g0181941 [Helianthus annuus]